MLQVVLYGKGGIGKSTIAVHLSAAYAQQGKRVLHLGCDPKMDSSLRLTNELDAPCLVDFIEDRSLSRRTPQDLVIPGKWGIDAIETGGPEPGLGCSGRGVATLLDFLAIHDDFQAGYDVTLFDVLGDLVCGGFVAPLRYGMADRVVICASGELMALYAANNISRVALSHAEDGARLAGIVFTVKELDATIEKALHTFSERINARVLGFIPWDPVVKQAERENQTTYEYAPDSAAARGFAELADLVAAPLPDDLPTPTPLGRREFMAFARGLDL